MDALFPVLKVDTLGTERSRGEGEEKPEREDISEWAPVHSAFSSV